MARLSANLGLLWPDRPLLDRVQAAAEAGFAAVELHWPWDTPAATLGAACRARGLALVSLNAPLGGEDLTLLLEPMNRRDRPGYFDSRPARTVALLDRLGAEYTPAGPTEAGLGWAAGRLGQPARIPA
jgi:hydroxypyruvate isomerase